VLQEKRRGQAWKNAGKTQQVKERGKGSLGGGGSHRWGTQLRRLRGTKGGLGGVTLGEEEENKERWSKRGKAGFKEAFDGGGGEDFWKRTRLSGKVGEAGGSGPLTKKKLAQWADGHRVALVEGNVKGGWPKKLVSWEGRASRNKGRRN